MKAFSLGMVMLCSSIPMLGAEQAGDRIELQGTASPAAPAPVQAVKPVTATRESMALSYPEGTTISIKFQGTHRLPRATGEAKVERKKGMTEIEIELDEMKPASFFGGDYNTYVLWTVSPEGHVHNDGEFVLRGNRSKLNVSTPLETFGMFVTAEPHFLVASPSRFVVLENTRPAHHIGNPLRVSQIQYHGFDGLYRFERETLSNLPETKGTRREDVGSAEASIALAERAGASQFAVEEITKAREAMRRTLDAVRVRTDDRNIMLLAHEVVRLAYDAQKKAEERSFQASLDAERRTHADQTKRLETSIQQAQNEAERSRLEAEQRALQLQLEARAREEAARRAAEAEAQAREASEKARREAAAAESARLAAESAKLDAAKATQEAEAARKRMQEALSAVAETKQTARGLIVNLPDILFDFNKATLRPQGREILAKISGILLVARGYRLRLEGHTDSIGSEEYNARLSEKRAEGVRDYLLQSGIASDLMTTHGFGKTQPIATNDTAAGRQRNRRVEIVIQGVEQFSSNR
jgi:outer membrane protein OmpA-like peptidoglycan-associated protein